MIFGNDNRTIIRNDSLFLYEYASMVQLVSTFPDGSMFQGSGTIVGVNDVLSAAHMLYSAGHGGYATSVEVTPLRLGELKPFGVVYAQHTVVSDGWIASSSYEGDYGLITLSRPIGYQSGWEKIDSVNPIAMVGENLQTYGYPGDLKNGEFLYTVSGSVDGYNQNILKFTDDLDAKGGQSGSGVFASSDTGIKLVGVVSYESRAPDYNGIVTFDVSIASQIQGWISANDVDLPVRLNADVSLRPIVEQIELMVYAFLGRGGTQKELNALLGYYTNGADENTLATILYNYDGYRATAHASMDNRGFLTHIFTNVLQISYTQGEFSHWLGVLDGGVTRAQALLLSATLPKFRELHTLDLYQMWHGTYRDFALEAFANDENTTLIAKEDDSALWGGNGNDSLSGGKGADYLYGGCGDDTLYGGGGGDFFVWDRGMGVDKIADFHLGEDILRLRSDFAWKWGTDSTGNLALFPDSGTGGVILVGVTLAEISGVAIIQG